MQLGVGNASGAAPVHFASPRDVDTADALHPVVAVRLWLLVRSESTEPGFSDGKAREFPTGRVVAAPNDSFRRLLVTTTIYLRNPRT